VALVRRLYEIVSKKFYLCGFDAACKVGKLFVRHSELLCDAHYQVCFDSFRLMVKHLVQVGPVFLGILYCYLGIDEETDGIGRLRTYSLLQPQIDGNDQLLTEGFSIHITSVASLQYLSRLFLELLSDFLAGNCRFYRFGLDFCRS
jgi:hypothetical protein